MRQAVELIARFPTVIAYAYNIYRHSVQERARREGIHTAQREVMSRVHIKIDIV